MTSALIQTAPDEQARAAYHATRTSNRFEEATLLMQAVRAYKRTHPHATDNEALAWVADGAAEPTSTGSLYNTLYLAVATEAGFKGGLTYLYAVGKALRSNALTSSELELMDLEQIKAKLQAHKVSNVETSAAALAPRQQQARDVLAQLDPFAPTAPTEADGLLAESFTVLAEKQPALARVVIHAARTGDTAALDDLAKATAPQGFRDWAVWHAHDFVSGELRTQQEPRLDIHHVALAGREARANDGSPEMIALVARHHHIPQPFSPTQTAHSRVFSVGQDTKAQAAYLYYLEIQHQRHEAAQRGQPDPWPVLPLYARLT